MKQLVRNSLVVFGALALGFVALELGARLYQPNVRLLTLTNFIYDRISLLRSGYPSTFDAELGYIPRPGYSGIANVWGTQVTIDEQGIRSNGQQPPDIGGAPSILALGDSFVFGDQVSNAESWPAQLEVKLRRRVINAGVFGYGLDQSVLRAYRLLDRHEVDVVILGMIADDLDRTELSVRTGVAKPYFELQDGALVRRNDPVPRLPDSQSDIGLLRSILGYSLLVDLSMKRLGLAEWWYSGQWGTVQVHGDGVEVACRLADKLRRDLEARAIHLIVLAQYPSWEITDPDTRGNRRNLEAMRELLSCLREGHHQIIDLMTPLRQVWEDDPERFRSFYSSHMTAAGNAFVADIVSRSIAHPVEGPHAVLPSLLARRSTPESEPMAGHSVCSQG
jgi:hypothetical protein